MTFYEQLADLSSRVFKYNLNQGSISVLIPVLEFSPPLQSSFNPDTGANGAVILSEAYLLTEDGEEIALPSELASFDSEKLLLSIDVSDEKYIGIQTLRFRYIF